MTDNAENDLEGLDQKTTQRIMKKLFWVAEHAEDIRHEGLTGQWQGLYRYRIGDYRALYIIERNYSACRHESSRIKRN
ncbi:MAG: type II toxin-antitoxin system mRNA interferase toxin, RelE/StbE family [Chloroflexi bacterium]|nr:MAG: type II toxin-antitoxin system mRNA interferase toxin, RelE/StbE family [Chloroflexota bacterium]